MAFRYSVEVRHTGLGKYRVISGTDEDVVQAKARAQMAEWNHLYQAKSEKERKLADRESKQQEAAERTADAQEAIDEVKGVLKATLSMNDAIDWETLKHRDPFPVKEPRAPIYRDFQPEPQEDAAQFQPGLTLLDKMVSSRVQRKLAEARLRFEQAHGAWQREVETTKAWNDERYNQYVVAFEKWNAERTAYGAKQSAENSAVDKREDAYQAGEPEAVYDYCELVLSRSSYPASFPKDFELEFNAESKILIVEHSLPAPEDLPRVREVKYVKSRDDFTEAFLPESEQHRLYDDVLCQICLRTIHELFEADVINALDVIVFNGWVRSIDRATGKETNGCVISVQGKKEAFNTIDLANVDPKACFKSLKGVGSSKLHSLTPVPPVLQ
jgi:restriction system protein